MCRDLHEEYRWLIGRHSKVKFWTDNWLGSPLIDLISSPMILDPPLESVVGDLWQTRVGSSLLILKFAFQAVIIESIVYLDGLDTLFWMGFLDSLVTYSDAYVSFFSSTNNYSWENQIWSTFIPPSRSILLWRTLYDRLPTAASLMRLGDTDRRGRSITEGFPA